MSEDHHIPEVRADQAMCVMAMAVGSFISAQAVDDIKKGQVLFALFVRQLASFSREPAVIASLLRICADELEGKLDDEPPAEEGANGA